VRQVPREFIWIGNAGDLDDIRSIHSAGIQAVVELADNEPSASLPRSLIRARFPIADGGENHSWLLRMAVDFVAGLMLNRVPTLVCCSAGMSRSVLISAAAISKTSEKFFSESLGVVTREGPADVSPQLLMQIENLPSD
jgi:protein-tyrosine phosphatase